jgi:hypothetical protein
LLQASSMMSLARPRLPVWGAGRLALSAVTNTPPRACLVLHGKAAMLEDVRRAVRAARDEGCGVDVRVTWEGGDASRFAQEAAQAGYGVVVAGGGDGTVNEVVAGMIEGVGKARILGGAAYLLTGLTHFGSIRPERGRLSGPGFAWEGTFLALAVGNGRQAGGGHRLCPEAMLNDRLLDVRLLPQLPKDEIPEALRVLLRDGLDGVRATLVGARVPWLEIETEGPSDQPGRRARDRHPLPVRAPPAAAAGAPARRLSSARLTRFARSAGVAEEGAVLYTPEFSPSWGALQLVR